MSLIFSNFVELLSISNYGKYRQERRKQTTKKAIKAGAAKNREVTGRVYSRVYVPEVKNFDIGTLGSVAIKNMEKKTNLSPKTSGHTESYDFLVSRLKKISDYGW